MLVRFLCTIVNFVVTLIGLRSNISICLLDAPPPPVHTVGLTLPSGTYKPSYKFNTKPSKATRSMTAHWTPLPTAIDQIEFVPRTPHLKKMIAPTIIQEPAFSRQSLELTYHPAKTYSIYDLPPSTTLSILFPFSGEYALSKYEPREKGLFEAFVTKCWSFVMDILNALYWPVIILGSIIFWVKYVL